TNTGQINVDDGLLQVDGSLATSNLVFADGTLGGSGTVPAVTISSIGTLAPGDSPGILNSGDVSFQSGSTFSVVVAGATAGTQYDQLNITGTVDLNSDSGAGATLDVSLANGYVPKPGTTYTIITATGSLSNTFNGLADGATITVGGYTFLV